jgi:hypothetical protein
MNLSFRQQENVPEVWVPGRIYFIKSEGAIYVASETDVVKYSGYKELEAVSTATEDLETIRNNAATGAAMANEFPTINNEDIDNLFNF